MSPEERAKILRERFKTLYPGAQKPTLVSPRLRKAAESSPRFSRLNSGWHSHISDSPSDVVATRKKPKWVKLADEKPNGLVPHATRQKPAVHPLTLISRKLKRGEIVWEKYPRAR